MVSFHVSELLACWFCLRIYEEIQNNDSNNSSRSNNNEVLFHIKTKENSIKLKQGYWFDNNFFLLSKCVCICESMSVR